jgi:hypothetical protein
MKHLPGLTAFLLTFACKAALDMRLVDPFVDVHGDAKLSRAADPTRALWQANGNVTGLLRSLHA